MNFEQRKRQKLQRQKRQNLKTLHHLANLQEITPLLKRAYPQIQLLQTLRLITCIQINYLISCYIETANKWEQKFQEIRDAQSPYRRKLIYGKQLKKIPERKKFEIQQLKIGIIGGGITGRLILNNLLVFTKQGLNSKNIWISTRQTEKFTYINENFGVNVCFDNQFVAQISDILIISTPATIDNWIIADLKEALQKRNKSFKQQAVVGLQDTSAKQNTQIGQQISSKQIKVQNSQTFSMDKINPVKPLIFILTSNIYQEKAERILNCPVLTPTIRASDKTFIEKCLQKMKEIKLQKNQVKKDQNQKKQQNQTNNEQIAKLIQKRIQGVEKIFAQKLLQRFGTIQQGYKKETINQLSQKYDQLNINISQNKAQGLRNALRQTLNQDSLNYFQVQRILQNIIGFNEKLVAMSISSKPTISVSESNKSTLKMTQHRFSNQQKGQDRQKLSPSKKSKNKNTQSVDSYQSQRQLHNLLVLDEMKKVIQDVLKHQQGIASTFLIKSRKWRMAYNNYIA